MCEGPETAAFKFGGLGMDHSNLEANPYVRRSSPSKVGVLMRLLAQNLTKPNRRH